ncbi:MAG: PAC2 family protein [Candidatus Nitrosocaldus sp.]|nr:PAC2 family protein [Candidatus Nitrosocaldus sp.]MCS7141452.1 PAC2 family protein [Candidatus Nitrosocaldus sp.]MDW7999658.1 PAC2 family protein [Candidatus Nitrosocaldus sp.]MDW8275312.1 PAC2 family protein [Candidatus Nitrosocaldus sp.]
MHFEKLLEPDVGSSPIMIAAMQDMGNVGSIVIDFINKRLNTRPFRVVYAHYPPYVVDKGGYIEFEQVMWEYRYAERIILFGGSVGQPESSSDLYMLCQDVIDVAKMYSVQFIYTVGAFLTDRAVGKRPRVLVTTTNPALTDSITRVGLHPTHGSSLITGFNGLILGFAKMNGINGIGLYGEIDDPRIPQYRAAKGIVEALERLTYLRFGSLDELERLAEGVDESLARRREEEGGEEG